MDGADGEVVLTVEQALADKRAALEVLRIVLKERHELSVNLTSVQDRCRELLEENRMLRGRLGPAV